MGSLEFKVREIAPEKLKGIIGEDNYAAFFPDIQQILVPRASEKMTEALREQVFYHELSHALLWTAGSRDYGNEAVIDAMGHALKQYFDTKE